MSNFNLVVCGGTFDHLHEGHKKFLRFVFARSERVLLGLTSDDFAGTKPYSESIESYGKRKDELEHFLVMENAFSKVEIRMINSVFIPAVWAHLPIDVIVVSESSQEGASIVNRERVENGLAALKIVVFPLVRAGDGKILSSTRIRSGEISRSGKPYFLPEWLTQTMQLPDNLRGELKKPIGKLIVDFHAWIRKERLTYPVAAVGDVVTKSFIAEGKIPDFSVVDFHVARKRVFSSLSELGFARQEKVYNAVNPAGTLTPESFGKVQAFFRTEKKDAPSVLLIHGEEDLLALPIILASPLGDSIFYGQPDEGVVHVEVTEEMKEIAYTIVQKFKRLY